MSPYFGISSVKAALSSSMVFAKLFILLLQLFLSRMLEATAAKISITGPTPKWAALGVGREGRQRAEPSTNPGPGIWTCWLIKRSFILDFSSVHVFCIRHGHHCCLLGAHFVLLNETEWVALYSTYFTCGREFAIWFFFLGWHSELQCLFTQSLCDFSAQKVFWLNMSDASATGSGNQSSNTHAHFSGFLSLPVSLT